ncbi:MAG: hypothetical protein QXH03_02700 [Candidatus Bathyarchaeia archaeon]
MSTPQEIAEPYLKESNRILAMPEPQRTIYVQQVILSLIPPIKKLAEAPILRKKEIMDKIVEEWFKKKEKILPAIIYSIKPEFRQAYLELIDAIAKIAP